MRKTFKLFCAAAMAVLAVSSCGKIWDEFDNVHGQLDSIEARLDSLESALNGQVATINTTLGTLAKADEKLAADIAAIVKDAEATKALIEKLDAADGTINGRIDDLAKALEAFEASTDKALADLDAETQKALAEVIAKIAVVKVEKNKAGNVILTFADGSTLEVSPADPNANNTGLVTVVDGKWAIVGADGKTTVLDAEVHPDTEIDFKVEENTLFVSYDGGKTWEKTDVVVNDETTINVVEDFEYTEGDTFVTITVGGKEYVLPLYEADNSSLSFGRTEAYFGYGATKNIKLVAEGVEEYYVMSKPDGWKVSVKDTILVVTAPSQELITIGAGEDKGELLVHATTETGLCKVVKLDVTAGPAMKISYKDGDVTFFSAMVETTTNWYGDEMTDFTSVWFGMIPVEEFVAYGSFEAYMATYPEYLSCLTNVLQNEFQIGYVEGEVEEFNATMSLVDILENSWSGFEMEEDVDYLFWAAPQGETTLLYDQAVYFMTDSYIEFAAADTTYNNVKFDAAFWGADSYVVGAMSKSQFNDWVDSTFTYEMALEQTLMGSWQPGPLMNFQAGDLAAMGKVYKSGTHSISLSEVMLPDYGSIPEVTPATDYFVWVLPYSAVKPFDEYTFKDLQISVCTTDKLVYNENLTPTVTVDTLAYNTVEITIVPPAGGKTAYELIAAADFEEFVDPESGDVDLDALVDYLQYNWSIDEKYTEEYGDWFITPNTTYYMLTYNVVAGEYSVTYEELCTTPSDPSLPTPLKKQWIIDPETNLEWADIEPYRGLLDFGVNTPDTFALAVSQEDAFPDVPEAAGMWMPYMQYQISGVVATDETSGVIKLELYDDWFEEYTYLDVPYSNLTEDTCEFDFSESFGFTATATLSDEVIEIMAGGIAM